LAWKVISKRMSPAAITMPPRRMAIRFIARGP
jgi:hypothetical protein